MDTGHAVQLRAGPRPGIIRLWLQRRDRPANLVDDLMIDDLCRAIDALEAMPDLAGVLLQSGGRDFLAGADLTRLDALRDPARSRGFSTAFHAATRRLERLNAPVVALIAGACMGGGFELALAADARVAVAGRFAIGCPEAAIGTMPGGGGTQRLPRLIGRLPALAMLALGRTLDPDAAWDTGILDAPPFADIAAAEAAACQIIQAIHAGDPSVLRRPLSDEQPSGAGATAEEAGILTWARALRHRRPGVLATCAAVLDGQSLDLDAALALEAGRFAALMAQPEPHRLVAGGFLAGRALARGIGWPAQPVPAPAAPRVHAGDGCAAVGISGDDGAEPAKDGDVTLVVLAPAGPVSGPVVPAACPDGAMGWWCMARS
ncbi:enoyl-CoA hydratase/isomerase family protein [Tistrella bauzanensis]